MNSVSGPMWRLPIYALLTVVLLLPLHAAADEIRVAVASNFRQAMAACISAYEQDSENTVTASYGSTGKQYAQILNGAPFDAFFAADSERPALLEQAGRIVPASRFTYAIGRLVLWSPQPGLVDPDGAVLRSSAFAHLAIANPELAPYGAAARSVLQAMGLWDSLQPRLVRGENIGQAYQFVFSGNAELGFVAASQLSASTQAPTGSSWQPPPSLYPPIEQQAVLLRDSGAARNFMDYMRSAPARAIIAAHGYDSPR